MSDQRMMNTICAHSKCNSCHVVERATASMRLESIRLVSIWIYDEVNTYLRIDRDQATLAYIIEGPNEYCRFVIKCVGVLIDCSLI